MFLTGDVVTNTYYEPTDNNKMFLEKGICKEINKRKDVPGNKF